MDEDPTFYKQFSELLEDTIRAYREKRLSEREYLNSVVNLASKVAWARSVVRSPAPSKAPGQAIAPQVVSDNANDLDSGGRAPLAALDAALGAAGPVIADIGNFTNTRPQMLIGEVIA